jgi:UDP-N-acetylmuramate dehydrogenase
MDLTRSLRAVFPAERVGADVPMAPNTTFRVGGPAQWFIETRSRAELSTALALAQDAGVQVTILGGGSNVLVADAGIRGLVIRPRGGTIDRLDEGRVRADAAVLINGLVRWSIVHGVAGIEAWAGTPGTVGGAVYGNAHFGGHLIGDIIEEVEVVGPGRNVARLPAAAMEFGYDRSRLQWSGEVALSAVFRVSPGKPSELRSTARASLAHRKRTQPLGVPTAGCVFQNPQPGRDVVPKDIPWSAGALVDRAGLKGASVGGARVSSTHGNFILNDGTATAEDIRCLIARCRRRVRDLFGVELKEEIVYLGEFHVDVGD